MVSGLFTQMHGILTTHAMHGLSSLLILCPFYASLTQDTQYGYTVISGFLVCLPTAVTHVIKVLEPQSSHEFQWQLAREA